MSVSMVAHPLNVNTDGAATGGTVVGATLEMPTAGRPVVGVPMISGTAGMVLPTVVGDTPPVVLVGESAASGDASAPCPAPVAAATDATARLAANTVRGRNPIGDPPVDRA